jgi:hypothetical protein
MCFSNFLFQARDPLVVNLQLAAGSPQASLQ